MFKEIENRFEKKKQKNIVKEKNNSDTNENENEIEKEKEKENENKYNIDNNITSNKRLSKVITEIQDKKKITIFFDYPLQIELKLKFYTQLLKKLEDLTFVINYSNTPQDENQISGIFLLNFWLFYNFNKNNLLIKVYEIETINISKEDINVYKTMSEKFGEGYYSLL